MVAIHLESATWGELSLGLSPPFDGIEDHLDVLLIESGLSPLEVHCRLIYPPLFAKKDFLPSVAFWESLDRLPQVVHEESDLVVEALCLELSAWEAWDEEWVRMDLPNSMLAARDRREERDLALGIMHAIEEAADCLATAKVWTSQVAQGVQRCVSRMRSEVADVPAWSKERSEKRLRDSVALSKAYRAGRRRRRGPNTTELLDIRIVPTSGELEKTIGRCASGFADRILPYLSAAGIRCPGFNTIFISIGENEDEALRGACHEGGGWNHYGIATIDVGNLEGLSAADRRALVFDTVSDGLKDVATLDGLDRKTLVAVLRMAKDDLLGDDETSSE